MVLCPTLPNQLACKIKIELCAHLSIIIPFSKIFLEFSQTSFNISYFVFSCSLPEVFLELIMEEAEEAREELKLFLLPSSAFTCRQGEFT